MALVLVGFDAGFYTAGLGFETLFYLGATAFLMTLGLTGLAEGLMTDLALRGTGLTKFYLLSTLALCTSLAAFLINLLAFG